MGINSCIWALIVVFGFAAETETKSIVNLTNKTDKSRKKRKKEDMCSYRGHQHVSCFNAYNITSRNKINCELATDRSRIK